MLINIVGTLNVSGAIEFELPNISLDQRFGYKIGVNHLNLEFRSTVSLKDNELLCLSSNLVDCSQNNRCQSLFNFAIVKNRKSIQNYKVQSVMFHNLQLYDLGNATFQIKRVFTEQRPVDITNIFIQLEISRIDAYGRFQQHH